MRIVAVFLLLLGIFIAGAYSRVIDERDLAARGRILIARLDGRAVVERHRRDALAGSSTQVPAGAAIVPGLTEALDGFEPTVKK